LSGSRHSDTSSADRKADHLREGIYALRVGLQGVHYRMLYFFHGTIAAVLSQRITTAQRVPARDITLAMRRQRIFAQDPSRHTYEAD
jgi:Phage derived protein Gp49-like (DUF891)